MTHRRQPRARVNIVDFTYVTEEVQCSAGTTTVSLPHRSHLFASELLRFFSRSCDILSHDHVAGEEGRDLPARVAFFSTPSGGRVCSVAGGRQYTAAVTSDGRLFAWGSQCECTRRSGVVEEAGRPENHDKGNITAVQITVPRLMEAASDGNVSWHLFGGTGASVLFPEARRWHLFFMFALCSNSI